MLLRNGFLLTAFLLVLGLSSCLQAPDAQPEGSAPTQADTDSTQVEGEADPEAAAEAEAPSPAPLLINLTSSPTQDAHAVLMGLDLAQHMHEQGLAVSVFLNVGGVNLMRPIAGKISLDGHNLQALLKELIDSGVTVLACPHCMEINGLSDDDLLKGVVINKAERMAERLAQRPTVFTY